MEQTLDLQVELKKRKEEMEKKLREDTEKYNKAIAERKAKADAEQAERTKIQREREEFHREHRRKGEEENKNRLAIEEEEKRKLEEILNFASEEKRSKQEELNRLAKEVADIEHLAELSRKTMEMPLAPVEVVDEVGFSVDHPTLEVNEGNAVAGTDGSTGSETMSSHLRRILRQSQRNY